jgi:hypothetical protein
MTLIGVSVTRGVTEAGGGGAPLCLRGGARLTAELAAAACRPGSGVSGVQGRENGREYGIWRRKTIRREEERHGLNSFCMSPCGN